VSNFESFYARWSPVLLSVLRIVVGFLFMTHGAQKLFNYPPPTMPGGKPSPFPTPLLSLTGVAGILEFFGGLFILLGLFTRPVAFILSGMMAVAYFMRHFSLEGNGFLPLANGGEPAVLFCFVFLYMAVAGGGRLSLDHLWRKSHDSELDRI